MGRTPVVRNGQHVVQRPVADTKVNELGQIAH